MPETGLFGAVPADNKPKPSLFGSSTGAEPVEGQIFFRTDSPKNICYSLKTKILNKKNKLVFRRQTEAKFIWLSNDDYRAENGRQAELVWIDGSEYA